jgi:ubiquitin-conjugating enzyme E2 variant
MNKKTQDPILRRFRLIEEYEKAKEGEDAYISYGLIDPDDRSLSKWSASIVGPQGTPFDRFYTLEITTGPNYPAEPPLVQFITKINLPYVDQKTGVVDSKKFDGFKNWKEDITLGFLLKFLKDEMKRYKSLKQPAEGTTFQ